MKRIIAVLKDIIVGQQVKVQDQARRIIASQQDALSGQNDMSVRFRDLMAGQQQDAFSSKDIIVRFGDLMAGRDQKQERHNRKTEIYNRNTQFRATSMTQPKD